IVILRPPNATSLSDRLNGIKKPDEVIRDYGIGAQILLDLGVKNMVLLSNNPKVVAGLDGYDLHIKAYRPIL
ncbi:MAG: 3,4-dihydroxy-2-butanone-4-phosphate synthase, partial [Alphaproteobacteria bacterium]|nr:3,4-dihydroxy-2-butanone-4-phosphate synthase [Alphaproteobacteria bacterium]